MPSGATRAQVLVLEHDRAVARARVGATAARRAAATIAPAPHGGDVDEDELAVVLATTSRRANARVLNGTSPRRRAPPR